jgi:hypothetical protein
MELADPQTARVAYEEVVEQRSVWSKTREYGGSQVVGEYREPEGAPGMKLRIKGDACHTIGLHFSPASARTVSRQSTRPAILKSHGLFEIACHTRRFRKPTLGLKGRSPLGLSTEIKVRRIAQR